jgi:DNA-binding GntR family transcriptional regulator
VWLYAQIADQIRQRIVSGELPPGSALPSEKALAAHHGVARQTVRRAVRLLKEEGVVYSSQGRGTFVGPEGAPQSLRKKPRYQQIADELIEQIKTGDYKPNRPIPSESTLVQRFDVAPGTVRQALAHLRELGWVFTVPQKATYVSQREDWPAGE